VQPEREQSHFGLATVELALTHASAPEANRATVANLIHSVLSNSAAEAEASAAGGSGGTSAGAGASPSAAASAEQRLRMEKEIEVDVARQEESYKTLFERGTIRPFLASYQKVTETALSLHVQPVAQGAQGSDGAEPSPKSPQSPVLHQITQTEYKNSRHVFIWGDVPHLSTKDYIQGVYQSYLDAANEQYAKLKADKDAAAANSK